MQTFMPVPSFIETAQILDYRRLGKQRVEAFQIIRTLENNLVAWANHPAVLMWKDHVTCLKHYYNSMVMEWVGRGYRNSMELFVLPDIFTTPEWIGDKSFHDSHKSNLLRKDFVYYSQFGWQVQSNLPYKWPSKK